MNGQESDDQFPCVVIKGAEELARQQISQGMVIIFLHVYLNPCAEDLEYYRCSTNQHGHKYLKM